MCFGAGLLKNDGHMHQKTSKLCIRYGGWDNSISTPCIARRTHWSFVTSFQFLGENETLPATATICSSGGTSISKNLCFSVTNFTQVFNEVCEWVLNDSVPLFEVVWPLLVASAPATPLNGSHQVVVSAPPQKTRLPLWELGVWLLGWSIMQKVAMFFQKKWTGDGASFSEKNGPIHGKKMNHYIWKLNFGWEVECQGAQG